MSNDIKLQKVILDPDWIDLSFGEPQIVSEALFKTLNRFGDPFKMPTLQDLPKWTYQPAAGKPDLVSILEKRYSSKVVVCNGAKHALAAALYAFKKADLNTIWYDTPYYPANPSLVGSAGMTKASIEEAQCFLVTSPNNPDGKNLSNVDLLDFRFRGRVIHDAAYYTPIYIPESQMPIPIGDIQIYSASKMYGISGLRIGYAVVHNEKFYQDVVNYVELTTAGVSTASQDIVRNIEYMFQSQPHLRDEFNTLAKENIQRSRELLKKLDPEVLEVIPSQSNSMFAWCKVGPKFNATAAKVYVLPGEIFGEQPGYVRLNIAYPPEIIEEAINRLNKNKI